MSRGQPKKLSTLAATAAVGDTHLVQGHTTSCKEKCKQIGSHHASVAGMVGLRSLSCTENSQTEISGFVPGSGEPIHCIARRVPQIWWSASESSCLHTRFAIFCRLLRVLAQCGDLLLSTESDYLSSDCRSSRQPGHCWSLSCTNSSQASQKTQRQREQVFPASARPQP